MAELYRAKNSVRAPVPSLLRAVKEPDARVTHRCGAASRGGGEDSLSRQAGSFGLPASSHARQVPCGAAVERRVGAHQLAVDGGGVDGARQAR